MKEYRGYLVKSKLSLAIVKCKFPFLNLIYQVLLALKQHKDKPANPFELMKEYFGTVENDDII